MFGIVKQNGGFINVYSDSGLGTTLSLYFPRFCSEPLPAGEERAPILAPLGQETLLLVEDDAAILAVTAKILEMQGYLVLQAGRLEEALSLAREHAEQISTVGAVTGLLGTFYGGSRVSSNLHGWHAHGGKGIVLILAIGICASVARVAMTRAYRLGNTLATANLQYTGILFSSAWGVLLWGDILNRSAWLGSNPCQRDCCDVLQRANPYLVAREISGVGYRNRSHRR